MRASKDVYEVFERIFADMQSLMKATTSMVNSIDPDTATEETIGYMKGYNAAVVDINGIFDRFVKEILGE